MFSLLVGIKNNNHEPKTVLHLPNVVCLTRLSLLFFYFHRSHFGSNWTRGAVLWRMSFRVVSVWKRPVAAEETKGEVFFRRERVTARCDVRENGLPDDHVFTKQERAQSTKFGLTLSWDGFLS